MLYIIDLHLLHEFIFSQMSVEVSGLLDICIADMIHIILGYYYNSY